MLFLSISLKSPHRLDSLLRIFLRLARSKVKFVSGQVLDVEAGVVHEVEDDRFRCLLPQPFLNQDHGLILLDESVGSRKAIEEALILGSEVVDGVEGVLLRG
jgi:hypothetical protein